MVLFFPCQCYSSQKLFDIFLVNSSGVNKGGFEKICPAIVQQMDSKSCLIKGEEKSVKPVTTNRSTKKEGEGTTVINAKCNYIQTS